MLLLTGRSSACLQPCKAVGEYRRVFHAANRTPGGTAQSWLRPRANVVLALLEGLGEVLEIHGCMRGTIR